jgi:hypothetical protein
MADIYESVLPSGRGIRFNKLRTKDYLAIQERVAMKLSGLPEAVATARHTMLFMREIICTCVTAVTEKPLAWKEDADGSPDVDAMLNKVKWDTVAYTDLVSADGWKSFDKLFDELDDFHAAGELIQGAARPTKARATALAGKVRQISMT